MLASGQQEQGQFRRGVGAARGPLVGLGQPVARPAPERSTRPATRANPSPARRTPGRRATSRASSGSRRATIGRPFVAVRQGEQCQARRCRLRPQRVPERRLVAVVPPSRDDRAVADQTIALDDPRMRVQPRATQAPARPGPSARATNVSLRPRASRPASCHVRRCGRGRPPETSAPPPGARATRPPAGTRPRDPPPPARAAGPAASSSPAPAASAKGQALRRAAGSSPASRNTPR